jgi:subtilisin-like proprotein convertase family protein
MKIQITILALMMTVATVTAQSNHIYNFAENEAIPQADPVGLSFSTNLTGMSMGGLMTISNVAVTLDVSGGFNGGLYAYLVGPEGNFAILLNRVGVGGSDTFGYADSGFAVTFNDAVEANNVHDYQNYSPLFNGNGQLLGTWAADGENISPLSSPSAYTGVSKAGLLTYNEQDPDGDWTLFIADLSSGSQSTIVDWGININTTNAPEPSSGVLFITGGGLLFIFRRQLITGRRKF